MIGRKLALSLLQYQLLDIFVCEDTWVLVDLNSLYLLIVSTILLLFQGFLRWYSVVDHFPFFLLLLAFRRTHSLIDTWTIKIHVILTRTAQDLILLRLIDRSWVIFKIFLFLLFGLLLCFRFKIIIIRSYFFIWVSEHHRGIVLQFGWGVVDFHREIIKFFILIKLSLIQHKYFSVSTKIVSLMLISLFRLFNRLSNLLFRSVFLSFTSHHPFLYFFITFGFHLLLPFLCGIHQIQSISYQTFLYVTIKRSISSKTWSVVYF